MAMPKKGARTLVVDGRKYRWSVSFTEDDTDWNEYGMAVTLTIAVEDYDNPQSRLCVHYRCGFQYGSDDLRPRSLETGEPVPFTPRHVAGLIREASGQGWRLAEKNAKVLVMR